MEYLYDEEDFIYEAESWENTLPPSKFDESLMQSWNKAKEENVFRYTLEDMKQRVVPGKLQFLLQLNPKRGELRRAPVYINDVLMPFDETKFHFNKVPKSEILFRMQKRKESDNDPPKKSDTQTRSDCDNLLMVNVSPLEYGHILLVPEMTKCINQVLTASAIQQGLELILLSSQIGFRIAFNSLGALASVNHLHLHAWYVNHPLFIETVHCTGLEPKNLGLYEMNLSHCRSLVLQLHGHSLNILTRKIHCVCGYLTENRIAHNVFITRGHLLEDSDCRTMRTVRVFIFPRKTLLGNKNLLGTSTYAENKFLGFNVAAAELAGQIPVYSAENYEELTENCIKESIRQNSLLTEAEYAKINKDLIKLFTTIDCNV